MLVRQVGFSPVAWLNGQSCRRFLFYLSGYQKGSVYLYHDGTVRSYGSADEIIDQAVTCLGKNCRAEIREGEELFGLVTLMSNVSCKINVLPYGEFCLNSVQASKRIDCHEKDVIPVWIREIDSEGRLYLSTEPVDMSYL